MADEPRLKWWQDGEQVRAILSDIGKWLIVIFSAYLSHNARVDSAVAKQGAETNAVRVGEVEKEVKATRPLVYGAKKE